MLQLHEAVLNSSSLKRSEKIVPSVPGLSDTTPRAKNRVSSRHSARCPRPRVSRSTNRGPRGPNGPPNRTHTTLLRSAHPARSLAPNPPPPHASLPPFHPRPSSPPFPASARNPRARNRAPPPPTDRSIPAARAPPPRGIPIDALSSRPGKPGFSVPSSLPIPVWSP